MIMATENETKTKREWLRCSSVVICFYAIVYFLLGGKLLGYLNPWLIGAVIVLAVVDILVLRKYIDRFMDQDDDQLP